MRSKVFKIEKIFLGLVLLFALVCNLAEAAEVHAISLQQTVSSTRAEITLDGRAQYQVLRLSNPERLVVDINASSFVHGISLPAGAGVVASVRKGQPVPGTARVVFDLIAPVTAAGPNMEWRDGKAVLILEWSGDAVTALARISHVQALPAVKPSIVAAQPVSAQQAVTASSATSTEIHSPPSNAVSPSSSSVAAVSLPQNRPQAAVPEGGAAAQPIRSMQQMDRGAILRPIIVAIDAGHGGQDPGAIGRDGTREKVITLAVAMELARLVDATPGLKAYLTRDADFHIPLVERYQRARRANADVFISIHADAAENRNARGSSVYVLSTRGASSQAARWLADRENAADLIGGVRLQDKEGTLASVLLDLSQSATQRASERMANEVLDGLKRLGKTHKQQIERANFVVLRSPDVPSMLVETAFISNPEEEARLRSASFQRQLARAILDGIHAYFTRMPPPGTHYAARRDRGGTELKTASP